MYHEIEGQVNMHSIIFDDEKVTIGKKSYDYSTIDQIEITSAPVFATYGIMTIRADGKNITIPFPRTRKEKLKRAIRDFEEKKKVAAMAPVRRGPAPVLDPYEELKKLKELLDMDIITKEEFDQKKKELLHL